MRQALCQAVDNTLFLKRSYEVADGIILTL